MKLVLSILGIALSVSSQAQTLTDVDVKPAFLSAQCQSHETDSIGTLGLRLNKLSSTQTDDSITITANSSLFVCTISTDGTKTLSWQQVNPYQGFSAQYYDETTNSVQIRKVFIDASKPYNKMKLMGVTYTKDLRAIAAEGTMKEDLKNTFSGQVELKKSTLLNPADIKALNAGQTVQKIVELYQLSNFTTIVGPKEIELGDESRSGQNLIFHFKKEGGQIRLVKISG